MSTGEAPWICRMLFEELCVNANGEIVCSCADPSGIRVFGNVHRDRIADVYDGPAYRAARRWQLEAPAGSYCPVLDGPCGGRVSRATEADVPNGRSVRLLQLEPVSACNLRCPSCPSTRMREDAAYRRTPGTMLPLATLLDVVEQLPDLEKILFYNFGEPFVHPDAVAFLRETRRRRPEVRLDTSTNGLLLTPATIEAIAEVPLLDRVIFSIDGASDASYRRYRVRGRLERALANLGALAAACERHGTRERVHLEWQYILFEWNDSDAELEAARSRAASIGVPLRFVVTHTPGASRRYTDGSDALRALLAGVDPYGALTCDARMQHLWRHRGVAADKYAAQLGGDLGLLEESGGTRLLLAIGVENRSPSYWGEAPNHRLGVRLRDGRGRPVRELPGAALPDSARRPGGRGFALLDLTLPPGPFAGDLFVDVVEDGVCWFSERSSVPLTIPLRSYAGPPRTLPAARIVTTAYEQILGRVPEPSALSHWTSLIEQGLPTGEFLEELVRASAGTALRGEFSERMRAQLRGSTIRQIVRAAQPAAST